MVFTLVLARYLSERTEQEDASAQTGAGNTITVCATGIVGQNGCDYIGGDNIQKAIDIAQNGTVVFIKSGNYVNVSVTVGMDKNITIEGDNSTFLKGIGYNEGINTMGTISLIDNSITTISNINFIGGYRGIMLRDNAHSTITNNQIISHVSEGIRTEEQSQAIIKNNFISNNSRSGVFIYDQSQANITNNVISLNTFSGIGTSSQAQATIDNNVINSNFIHGIHTIQQSKAIVLNNTLVANGTHGIGCGEDSSCNVINNISVLNKGGGIVGKSRNNFTNLKYNLSNNNNIGNFDDFYTANELSAWGNIQVDPQFVSATDFHLKSTSPAKNTGDPNIKDTDGSRSDMGMYGGPNSCPNGGCEYKPLILNSSFEWGNLGGWNYGVGIDSTATRVVNCEQFGPCSDEKQYLILARNLSADKSKADFSTEWIETGQDLGGKKIRVTFNAKAHSTASVHQPPPALEGLFIQREHTNESGWLQQIAIPKTTLTGSWKTYSFDLTIPATDKVNTSRFRIVLKPELNYGYQLGYYYDNIRAEVLASTVVNTPTTKPVASNTPKPVATNTPTPTPTATPTPQPQAEKLSQIVLNDTGDTFYYRSCNMDKTKEEGVDYNKCNNYSYNSEVWTKHSVKSLLIKDGTVLQSKLRSLDIDHRYEPKPQSQNMKDMIYYTAVSETGNKVFTKSCEAVDNQDVANCSAWYTTPAQNIGAPSVTKIGSLENTTFYRNGKYYTTTKLLNDSNGYEFWSKECEVKAGEVSSTCSNWVKDDHQASMNNYKSSNTYQFQSGTAIKMKESFLTDVLGSIENYVCTFSPNSTNPYLSCHGNSATTKPTTDVETLQIPVNNNTKLKDANSISTFVSDLQRLDLPAECRATQISPNSVDVLAGNDISLQNLLNAKVPFNNGYNTQFQLTLPSQLDKSSANATNTLCSYTLENGVGKYTCGYGNSSSTGVYVKIKDSVAVGTEIKVNSQVQSGEVITTCPVLTLTVKDIPNPEITNTPKPTATPTVEPALVDCRDKTPDFIDGNKRPGSKVEYLVRLRFPETEVNEDVVVRDELPNNLELVEYPSFCEVKTGEVFSSVLGISDFRAERGALLISIILIAGLSGGVAYLIVSHNKGSVKIRVLADKPYLVALLAAGSVLLIGTIYFMIKNEDVSPTDSS
ncbi:right-handed parallel beta-helix repeat-containing protein, partial [Candidatus Dojkabacteria bacterium]|nr:right-handed parallel beta-helix repeat-containing protein [Candidatus Dojkabacteria bacterium]